MSASQPIKSLDDIQRVRDVLTSNRDRALFELGLHLAFRGGDLLKLNIRHVANAAANDQVVLTEKKTGKRRTTVLNQQCIDALRPLLAERLVIQCAASDDPLFVAAKAPFNRLTIVTLSRLWKLWCERAGLQGNFASHTGRKTKAYILRTRDGLPIEVLMQVLNHSSPAMTLRYMSIQPEEVKQFYMAVL